MFDTKKLFNESIYIFSPENRIFHYLYHSEYIFGSETLTFIKKLDEIKKKNYSIIVDQTLLKKILETKIINYNLKIYTILWNGHFDYLKYKNILNKIIKKYKNFKIITQNNFEDKKKYILPLNNFKFFTKRNLKKINGISLIKKIKYNYPIFYSIFNFLKHFKQSNKFLLRKRIVFVGRGDLSDTLMGIELIKKKNFKRNKEFFKRISKDLKNKNFFKEFTFKKLLTKTNFGELKFHEKYYISNLLIRYLIINYLKKFKTFYHKNNSNYPLDFLNSNIYKNLIQLEIGSKVGNSEIYSRRIMIKKFYENSFIKINFFKNNTNYKKKDLLSKRLLKIDMFFKKLYEMNDFNFKLKNILNNLQKLNTIYLNY